MVVANGAWMNELLPIPVASCKGQMLSLRPQPGQSALLHLLTDGPHHSSSNSSLPAMATVLTSGASWCCPPGTPPPLSRVLFGDGCYIIPKTDGRIVVGATVEDGIMDRR